MSGIINRKENMLREERLGRICEIQKNAYRIKYMEKELPGKLKGVF